MTPRPALTATSTSRWDEMDTLHTVKLLRPSPRHLVAPPRSTDHEHTLLGQPSQRTSARARATMSYDLDAHSPSSKGKTHIHLKLPFGMNNDILVRSRLKNNR
jgi:hypothetical protein